MQGVGPGTIVGDRYSLRRRLTQGGNLERWSSHDTTLERDVTLTIVSSDHPHNAGLLDAARRAAGVEDTRLVRILDVGSQTAYSYVVEEALDGAESLAVLLLQGALPAEEARRIAGETASGLETARQRGLHHLRLTPHSVLRAPDGAIKVSGVAVAAAINGTEETDPAAASRRDAVAVVALTYAALTSRWPLNEQVHGIEPAPRVVGGVPAPSEIAAAVPGDLDALCRMTLNDDTGPLTPGDFASQIAPWSRSVVHRSWVEPTLVLDRPSPDAPVSTTTQALTPPDLTPPDLTPPDLTPPDLTPPDLSATAGAPATKVIGTALAGAGAAAGIVGDRVGSFARAATDKAAAARAARASRYAGGERLTLPEVLSARLDEIEPPLPMLPASTALAPSRDQSKVVVIIVATFVTLSLLVGYCGTRGMGEGAVRTSSTPRRTVTVVAPPVTVPPSSAPTTRAVPAPRQPVAILSATGFDPEGDKSEKNAQAARVYDGNPTTAWASEGYNSTEFGGLGKKGLGILLDLGQPTSVKQVILDLAVGPVDVTVYAATTDSLEGATIIGTAADATGRVQLKAASTTPAAQFVIVWFTKLAPDGGRFRAAISEIALS